MAKNLTKQEKKKVEAYCKLFPKALHVRVIPCEDTFTIRIKEFPNAITQVNPDIVDLIEMVSDCVATVLKIPKNYLSFMPRYLPSMI